MDSVTGESGPISTDRSRPAVSHEVPGRVERLGPMTSPGGLRGGGARILWRGGVFFQIAYEVMRERMVISPPRQQFILFLGHNRLAHESR